MSVRHSSGVIACIMRFAPLPRFSVVIAASLSVAVLLLSGCLAPGYPYNGTIPVPSAGIAPQQVPPPGVVVTTPVYPSYPYAYAPAPVIIAPSFYEGRGNGYWYGNRFWPYHNGCHFYNGRYYGGYNGNYWNGNRNNWQGNHGTWQGGNGNWHR